MKSVAELLAADGRHENWIPLLEVAAKEVFELMLSCQLTGPANMEEAVTLDVTSMVGLAGRLCGVLSVRCNGKAAALMTSKMLGVALDKVGPEVADALGEVCNMVAGNFKNKIAGLAEGCMLSPPTVITGNDYSLYSMADSPALEVVLLFEGMPIVISLQIHC
ncbi:MAG: chemotaxis protein CheX [Candidatus Sulfotelmatobacter sp.]